MGVVPAKSAAPAVAQTLPSAPEGACTPSLQITNLPADQSQYYGDTRSYDVLKANYGTSFPNLAYFTGLNCVRYTRSVLIGSPPSYISPCTVGGGSQPSLEVVPPPIAFDAGERANYDVESTFREFRALVYRLRTCDYVLSVIAWNTQGRGVTDTLSYSWKVGCNSFLNESAGDFTAKLLERAAEYVDAAQSVVRSPKNPAAIAAYDAAYAHFVFARYDEYDDLNERLQSCADVVTNFTYPPNRGRFFCNYGGLIGALLTGSAIAFGRQWGGSTSSTQSVVQGLGTVFIAIPALCQNGASSPTGGKSH